MWARETTEQSKQTAAVLRHVEKSEPRTATTRYLKSTALNQKSQTLREANCGLCGGKEKPVGAGSGYLLQM